MRKSIAVLAGAVILLSGCSGITSGGERTVIAGLDTDQKVSLEITIPYETNKALNTAANSFMKKYPNVSISLQYVEDYDNNAVKLLKEDQVDMILTKDMEYTEYTVEGDSEEGDTEEEAVLDGTTTDDFFYNFAEDKEIDFSNTTPDISDNFHHTREAEDGSEVGYQYCYPLGGETRGVFVNKTLLDQYGLKVPSNYTEFVDCCQKLKENGLVAIQGGGDTAAYGLGIAPAANKVVHDPQALEKMKNAEAGVSAEFEDVIGKIYNLAVNRYMDYKAMEEAGYYLTTNELGQAESFLGLTRDENTLEMRKPKNNYGYGAFLPYISSTQTVIESLIEEYDLDTELEFICSPLNDEGENSPVYITPYYGICINKNSEDLGWAREFVNFLFQKDTNERYAAEAAIIPNVTDAMDHVAEQYHVDADQDITLCGQIRFSDEYNGFKPIANALKETLKCNAQKYMVDLNRDENGVSQYETDDEGRKYLYKGNAESIVYEEYVGTEDSAMPGFAFCTEDYFLNLLEEEFAYYRVE